jgi:hypothetical protein
LLNVASSQLDNAFCAEVVGEHQAIEEAVNAGVTQPSSGTDTERIPVFGAPLATPPWHANGPLFRAITL